MPRSSGSARKPGPVPKGTRSQFTMRVPESHKTIFDEAAAAAGFKYLTDYLAAVLAVAHDLEVPDYVHRKHPEEGTPRLPIAG